jgi:hypothetical protein
MPKWDVNLALDLIPKYVLVYLWAVSVATLTILVTDMASDGFLSFPQSSYRS